MKKVVFLILLLGIASTASAGEFIYDYSFTGNGFYGYSDYADKYRKDYKHNHMPAWGELYTSGGYSFDNGDEIKVGLDGQISTGKELEDYNHGKWGENLYASYLSNLGEITAGQVYNAAYQMAVGAPSVGVWRANNSPIVDFIANPNWQRNDHTVAYRTLNSTYLNTDADAPKISYVSPELYNTKAAFSYTPDSYSRAGLQNKHSRYAHRSSYAAGLYNYFDASFVEVESSLGYAYNHKNNQEVSAGLSLYRKGWTLGGSYRKSFTIPGGYELNQRRADDMPEYFDGYRRGDAYNVGLSYEIGPFKTGISYFASNADKSDCKDKTISWANRFAYNKYIAIYAIGAYAEYKGGEQISSNRGYAFIGGLEINL